MNAAIQLKTTYKDSPVTDPIPEHLTPFISEQDSSLYTWIDHASWRYIMRVSKAFFKDHAHQKYLDGLVETGISTEKIPSIHEMDHCLRRFGWRAVGVVGFIPPAVFLEFQSLGILAIACDMRTLEHLAYTPAPDIVHEAAGHAPIISDPEYRAYLRSYGQVARNAIFSYEDLEIYETVRDLSDIKEDPLSTPQQIQKAQESFEKAAASISYVSEANQLARMAWWTVEYGLIGDFNKPVIYGAGLLSSVGESYHCFSDDVKKMPLTIKCVNMGYDITRPQPQLFVTPDFATLNKVLEEFAETMAFRTGGLEALQKALAAKTTTTTVLDSGIQISSTLQKFLQDSKSEPIYLQFQGPTQLAFRDQQLEGHGPQYHSQGFGTPIGLVKVKNEKAKPASLLTTDELIDLGFEGFNRAKLEFTSGVIVVGILKKTIQKNGKNLILSFDQCDVKRGEQILFRPEWGMFDMACGKDIVSVFGGAADRTQYLKATGGYKQKPASQKTNLTNENKNLNTLYGRVREIREKNLFENQKELSEIHAVLESQFKNDWLLRLELLELNSLFKLKSKWSATAQERLQKIAEGSTNVKELISRGLELIQ